MEQGMYGSGSLIARLDRLASKLDASIEKPAPSSDHDGLSEKLRRPVRIVAARDYHLLRNALLLGPARAPLALARDVAWWEDLGTLLIR